MPAIFYPFVDIAPDLIKSPLVRFVFVNRCIPSTKCRRIPLPYKTLYKQRHKIENMFARLKDWRRIATRYDRCARTFFSSICIAATLAFYLNQ
jgi:hypothetical protein